MDYLRHSQHTVRVCSDPRACHLRVGLGYPNPSMPQEAQPGARAHGYVTGVQDYGVFVGFCGELCGLAPAAELGLPAGQRPSQGFKAGQAWRPPIMLDVPVCETAAGAVTAWVNLHMLLPESLPTSSVLLDMLHCGAALHVVAWCLAIVTCAVNHAYLRKQLVPHCTVLRLKP